MTGTTGPFTQLPPGLPVPEDDGAADHLVGLRVPVLGLPSTSGRVVDLHELGPGRTVIYLYPMSGRPGTELPDGWDGIPGARGCTPESCAFRDHHDELLAAGATAVFGLSSQDTDYQRELAERVHLPFELLSDPERRLAGALGLPLFDVAGLTLYKRLTLLIRESMIEHVFYPVFPPDGHAEQVLGWLRAN